MYLNDLQRKDFYAAIGLDARTYDIDVIRKTNETAARVFPVILNVDHPEFFKALDKGAEANEKLVEVGKGNLPKPFKLLARLPHIATIGWQIARLYFMKPINAEEMRTVVR